MFMSYLMFYIGFSYMFCAGLYSEKYIDKINLVLAPLVFPYTLGRFCCQVLKGFK